MRTRELNQLADKIMIAEYFGAELRFDDHHCYIVVQDIMETEGTSLILETKETLETMATCGDTVETLDQYAGTLEIVPTLVKISEWSLGKLASWLRAQQQEMFAV